MLIKKITAQCKKNKCAVLFDDRRSQTGDVVMQWLSTGRAIYPLFDAPYFETSTLVAAYDFDDKIAVSHERDLPKSINFADAAEKECVCTALDMNVAVNGRTLQPYVTQQGIAFLDAQVFAPLKDADAGQVSVYERYAPSGERYFAVKSGFMLYAIVLPESDVINREFVEELELLHRHCHTALLNQKGE